MNTFDIYNNGDKVYDVHVENEYEACSIGAASEKEAIAKAASLMGRRESELFGVEHNWIVNWVIVNGEMVPL